MCLKDPTTGWPMIQSLKSYNEVKTVAHFSWEPLVDVLNGALLWPIEIKESENKTDIYDI
jgi:hypothetical protein